MGQFFLAENECHIDPNMCAKFGCGPTVVSKKGGGVQTDRQTKKTAALYSRWTPEHAYLHTNSFVHTENVFRSALQNAGKRSDLSATASSGTPARSLFNTEQRRPALAAFSNNNAVFFLDQSTQHFDMGPYKTTSRKHRSYYIGTAT